MTPVERAQMAMMLEVTAYPKPGNVDRCHDFEGTRLEHFLASSILVRPAFEKASGCGSGIGEVFREAVRLTTSHTGGNTHFGAFILLIPLLRGGDIQGAIQAVNETTVEDAVDLLPGLLLHEGADAPGQSSRCRRPPSPGSHPRERDDPF